MWGQCRDRQTEQRNQTKSLETDRSAFRTLQWNEVARQLGEARRTKKNQLIMEIKNKFSGKEKNSIVPHTGYKYQLPTDYDLTLKSKIFRKNKNK